LPKGTELKPANNGVESELTDVCP